MSNTELTAQETTIYPALSQRIQSVFIDFLLIAGFMFLFAWMFDRFNIEAEWLRAVLFISLWAVYEPLCVATGCTLGQYIMKLRVRREANTSNRISILSSFIRFIFKTFLGWLSFITIHFTEKKRAIHDIISGSVMITI